MTLEQQVPETIDFRDLPPVEDPIERRTSYRQTFLKQFSRCARSAYLYERYDGGAASHALLRGSALHRVLELATRECLATGEVQIPFDVVKAIVNEVLAQHPLPPDEADAVRIMAYHWAEATLLPIANIAGVEAKFTLHLQELDVTGTIDRLELYEDPDYGIRAKIIDYKTSLHMPDVDDYARPRRDRTMQWIEFQGIVYALGALHGVFENGLDLGGGINFVEIAQVFPMYLIDDDRAGLFLGQRSATLERDELADNLSYLQALVSNLSERFADQKWQAIPGSHCSECPAVWDCPLPEVLRDMHGTVNTPEEAEEAAVQWEYLTRHASGLKREIKAWANHYAPDGIRFGRDFILQFFQQAKTEIPDKAGLQVAVERAAQYGEPFDIENWVKRSTSTRFDKKRLPAREET